MAYQQSGGGFRPRTGNGGGRPGGQRSGGSRPSFGGGNSGGGRPSFNRGRSGGSRGPVKKYINPSKFINQAVAKAEEVPAGHSFDECFRRGNFLSG